ncbi:MAG: PAS domain-containing protein [Methanomassiliicoccaceae archaeon]|nr:PAS domain-containing protein [Methanomassiliicoccaceae archaeon]
MRHTHPTVITAHIGTVFVMNAHDADEDYTESVLNIILDEIDDIIIIHDSRHTIVWMNRAGVERFGRSLEDVIGKECYTLFGRSVHCENCTITSAIQEDASKKRRVFPSTGEFYECTTIPLTKGDDIKLVVQHLRRIEQQ